MKTRVSNQTSKRIRKITTDYCNKTESNKKAFKIFRKTTQN